MLQSFLDFTQLTGWLFFILKKIEKMFKFILAALFGFTYGAAKQTYKNGKK